MAGDVYKFAGDVTLSSIVIKSTNGTELDITPQVVELNIFESLFANSVTATALIVDSIGLIGNLPITGFESVTFTINNPNTTSKTLDFFLYKVSPRSSDNPHTQIYALQMISYEAILDQTSSFSTSVSGKISTAVKNVFKRFFGGRNKIIEIEETDNSIQAINPYWTPFQFINWLANRAFPQAGRSPSYFFFETISGFYFKSLDNMFKRPASAEYIFRPPNIPFPTKTLFEKMITILDFRVLESASSLELVGNGAFGSQMFVKDLNENSFVKKTFTYSNSNIPKLNEFSIKPNMDAFGSDLESPNYTKVAATTGQPFTGVSDINNFDRWVLERKSIYELLNAKRVEIYVAGHISIEVGKTVELVIPNSDKNIDDYISGKYLVVGVNHTISAKAKHMMSLELVSESYISRAHKEDLIDRLIKVSK